MNKRSMILVSTLSVIMLLALTVGLTLAQGSAPGGEPAQPGAPADTVGNYIPVQGRLTDASGNPLNATLTITFRLYDVPGGGTELCHDTNTVAVNNGLFNSEIYGNCAGQMIGQQLYLGLQVGGDAEMTPRQPIYAVPYAWSLKPGAIISGATGVDPIVHIETWSTSGRGLRAYAMAETGTNYGMVGASRSPNGYGGYFYDTAGGVGLKAESDGVALQLTGSGRITSTAKSYIWISGNDLRPYHQSDTTVIDADTVGGAKISPGATVGPKNVMLPIAVPAELYGQEVRVTGLDIDWVGSTDFDGISAVLLRRQTGVCETPSCYASILHDDTDQVCTVSAHATGCRLHFNLTANNVLSADSGVLYLTLGVNFGGSTGWVEIGGVRLTLEHD
jgi:hypothetical protein